ncbi:DNA topoisomerase domain-containing protein [Ditylenchus destructor]|uniref:DNA topoisomerase n=1 Tax=Ditylenchus destructor TaxID=166010 RepID=A0AAD4NEV2_9BILA|nr:DNA topoisomerase domain-containing protein [Ditylenchus destructor]
MSPVLPSFVVVPSYSKDEGRALRTRPQDWLAASGAIQCLWEFLEFDIAHWNMPHSAVCVKVRVQPDPKYPPYHTWLPLAYAHNEQIQQLLQNNRRDTGHMNRREMDDAVINIAETNEDSRCVQFRPCFTFEQWYRNFEDFDGSHATNHLPVDIVNNKAVRVLIVTEKHSLAQELKHRILRAGATFLGHTASFEFASTNGHLLEKYYTRKVHQYKPKEIYDARIVKLEGNADLCEDLDEKACKCDVVLLALDNDEAGELICLETVSVLYKFMKRSDALRRIYRVRFSHAAELLEQLENPMKPDWRKAAFAEIKRLCDFRSGIPLSFNITKILQRSFNIDPCRMNHISIGPCQMPTLSLCVEYNREPHAEGVFTATVFNGRAFPTKFVLQKSPITEDEFKRLKETFTDSKEHRIEYRDYKIETNKEVRRPLPLNTVALMRAALQHFGSYWNAKTIMNIAQKIYCRSCISYPRTETAAFSGNGCISTVYTGNDRAFAEDLDFRSHFLCQLKKLAFYSNDFITNTDLLVPAESGPNKGDHPPIYPTFDADLLKKHLCDDEQSLYDLICKYFIACHLPNCQYDMGTVTVFIDGHPFEKKFRKVTNKGFTSVLPLPSDDYIEDVDILPTKEFIDESFSSELTIKNVIHGEFIPNLYISESELIDQMNKRGIGTDASIQDHIHKIITRGYAERISIEENRFIQPTVVGICMYDTCKAINQEIVDPQSRSNFEQRMQDMRKSKFRNSQTVDEWERTLRGETQKINEHFVKEMDNHVEKFDGCVAAFYKNIRDDHF